VPEEEPLREESAGSRGWHPTGLSLLLIGLAIFCGAVGVGDILLGERALRWLLAGAFLLLLGVLAGGD
jgi:hypothetical protein